MNFLQQSSLFLTPVLFGLLAWFIKRFIEKSDESFSSLRKDLGQISEQVGAGRRSAEDALNQFRNEFHDKQSALLHQQSNLAIQLNEAKAASDQNEKAISVQIEMALIEINKRAEQAVDHIQEILLKTETTVTENEKKHQENWGRIIFLGETLKQHDARFKSLVQVLKSFQTEVNTLKAQR